MNIITPVRIITKYIKNEPKDLWNPFKGMEDLCELNNKMQNINLNNHLDDLNNRQDDQFDGQIKYKSCVATLISYGNEYYVITCYHVIQDGVDIYMFVKLNDEVISCKMLELCSFKPYDFSVLKFSDKEFESKIKKYGEKRFNNLKTNIKFLKKFSNEFRINILSHDDHDITKKLDIKQIKCQHVGYNISKIKSELYPAIPIIEIKINDTVDNLNYEGLSGSLVTDTNKVHGMISNYDIDTKILCVIPSYCLKLFFTMSLTNKKIESFCFSTKVCNFVDDKIGHIITKGYSIIYKTDMDKDIKFKNYDIIESVNDVPFNENGDLYFKKLGIYVPLDTYFILDNCKYYKFKYHAKRDINYVEYEKSVFPIQLEKYIKFNLEYHNKIIKYKGLIITEMSEQLLNHYEILGINISGQIANHYNDCYSSINQKLVVIINAEYSIISENISDIYKRIGLPLIKDTGNKYYIPLITKINGKKINNLEDMEIMIKSESDLSIHLEIAQKQSLTLIYEADDLFIK